MTVNDLMKKYVKWKNCWLVTVPILSLENNFLWKIQTHNFVFKIVLKNNHILSCDIFRIL